ncbi:MAG TPA: GWxTD domain-containing protein [Flavobacteriales bacterium]|nr:GWxTD domain-containing protein [Flavobacteriales bacterium]
MVVDSVFGGCRSGHGADTDQGYVYLKYGRPNTIVQRLHGTDYYPYEIWHYHHTLGLSNRRFLFYAPHVVGECLEILQTDLPGEKRNDDWIEILKSRENRLRVTDSQLNRLNPRDTFSREEPEDLYYNPR